MRVPYGLSVHDDREARAVLKVIQEHRTAVGRETAAFERQVARLLGKRHGVMVNSGSSANLLALTLLDLPPGSEVITPALTFNTTVAPILQLGLSPVIIDVRPDTLQADAAAVERAVTRRTRALMIPLLFGNVPEMDRLSRIARRHELSFIEDSCDTIGAVCRGRPAGGWSDITTSSFYGSHIVNAAGGGGILGVDRADWDRRLRLLRGWGRRSSGSGDSESLSRRFTEPLDDITYDGKFVFAELGYNFLPLEISAAFGRVQLSKLDTFARLRARNFAALHETFSSYGTVFELPRQTPRTRSLWHAFPLIVRDEAPFSRMELATFLEKRNIQTRPLFSGNILRHPAYRELRRRFPPDGFPVADRAMRAGLLIGCHQGLTPLHLDQIARALADFLRSRRRAS